MCIIAYISTYLDAHYYTVMLNDNEVYYMKIISVKINMLADMMSEYKTEKELKTYFLMVCWFLILYLNVFYQLFF